MTLHAISQNILKALWPHSEMVGQSYKYDRLPFDLVRQLIHLNPLHAAVTDL